MVIQFQYDPHGYASALLTLEKINYRPKPLAVAAAGKKNDLLYRIECMLGVQKKQAFSFNKLAGLFAALLCFIVLNALLIVSKPAKGTHPVASLTDMSSPLYFFTESDADPKPNNHLATPNEIPSPAIVNHLALRPASPAVAEVPAIPHLAAETGPLAQAGVISSPLTYVNLVETFVPQIKQLKAYQEEQVQEAVAASKKVLEEKQWKDVEKGIADVLTSSEKNILKGQYELQLSKVDWNKMQDKLRMAYDKIDWNKVDESLNSAIYEIRIDSLQQVYSVAMSELSSLQKELNENNVKGIPDTDISLKVVEQTKKNVQIAINTLNKVRTRKIVHL